MRDIAGGSKALFLTLLPEILAICQLPEGSSLPAWMPESGFRASLHTPGELTVVCEQRHIPADVKNEAGWKALGGQGSLDFGLVGVLAALVSPLASAGVSVFALSTFDTDYLLVKETALEKALQSLEEAGHTIVDG